MKLVVGLGNPGKEYENTRHNIGFMILDLYAKKNNLSFEKQKFNGLYTEEVKNGEKIVYVKPQSYMNLSGEVVGAFAKFYKIEPKDIFVIHDDLDLPLGSYKIKPQGGSGGHNGLKNIELHLQSNAYARLKIGISKNKNIDTKDYVLGKFTEEEREVLNPILEKAVFIVEDYGKYDFNRLMNYYN